MRIGAFEIERPSPRSGETRAFAILRPWIDAGNVGSLTLSWLEDVTGARKIGELVRPSSYFDLTRYRPVIYRQGGQREVVIPNTYISYGRPAEGPDYLFLHLLEPHMLGETYVESVLAVLEKFNVRRYCLLGSMYDFVSHTRPLLVTGGTENEEEREKLAAAGVRSSDYEGPTTICYLISQLGADFGMESTTMIVHLPQYTELAEDYIGVVRMKEILSSLYGFRVDEESIGKAEWQRAQINAEVAKNPQMQEIIEKLELSYDARNREMDEQAGGTRLSPEVEDFLKEMERRFRRE